MAEQAASHEQAQDDKARLVCETCGETFAARKHLKRHQRIHDKARQFICKVCDRGFTRQDHFQFHLETHVRIKRYQCLTCDKRYLHALTLRRHQQATKHEGTKKTALQETVQPDHSVQRAPEQQQSRSSFDFRSGRSSFRLVSPPLTPNNSTMSTLQGYNTLMNTALLSARSSAPGAASLPFTSHYDARGQPQGWRESYPAGIAGPNAALYGPMYQQNMPLASPFYQQVSNSAQPFANFQPGHWHGTFQPGFLPPTLPQGLPAAMSTLDPRLAQYPQHLQQLQPLPPLQHSFFSPGTLPTTTTTTIP